MATQPAVQRPTLRVQLREGRGKGPARRLRRQGLLPAVLYGPGIEAVSLSVDPRELRQALHTPLGLNTVLQLQLGDGRTELAIVRDVQRDPVTYEPLHVDFYRVEEDRPVDVVVHLGLSGRF